MKTLRNLLLIMLLVSMKTFVLKAENRAYYKNYSIDSLRTLKVDGNCEMCQEKIQKAALGVKGVKTASWDVQSHILTLDISQESKLDDVYKAVAKAGYDTEKYKSTEKDYKALPGCCQYRNL